MSKSQLALIPLGLAVAMFLMGCSSGQTAPPTQSAAGAPAVATSDNGQLPSASEVPSLDDLLARMPESVSQANASQLLVPMDPSRITQSSNNSVSATKGSGQVNPAHLSNTAMNTRQDGSQDANPGRDQHRTFDRDHNFINRGSIGDLLFYPYNNVYYPYYLTNGTYYPYSYYTPGISTAYPFLYGSNGAYSPYVYGQYASATTIVVRDFTFTPAVMQVPVGASVIWQFTGPSPHTTTSDPTSAMSWSSGVMNAGMSFGQTFTVPGTFPYHCALHPQMQGTVIVR